jgi:hypothetical protein
VLFITAVNTLFTLLLKSMLSSAVAAVVQQGEEAMDVDVDVEVGDGLLLPLPGNVVGWGPSGCHEEHVSPAPPPLNLFVCSLSMCRLCVLTLFLNATQCQHVKPATR